MTETRRRWGKAGQPLTAQQATEIARRKHQCAADEQKTYRAWKAGHVTPWRITAALDLRNLYGPEVDEACGVQEPCVDMWEDGHLYPTWEQLYALAELTDFPVRFFTLGGEPLRVEETTLLCGATKAELAAWQRDHREPVLEFTPEAIAATVGGAPVERPRIHPRPDRTGHRVRPTGTQTRRDPQPGQTPRTPGPRPRTESPRHAPRPSRPGGAADMSHLDRTGEPIEDGDPSSPEPVCICDGSKPGFADYNGDRPRPCPRHKPKLQRSRRRERLWGASDPGPDRRHPDSIFERGENE